MCSHMQESAAECVYLQQTAQACSAHELAYGLPHSTTHMSANVMQCSAIHMNESCHTVRTCSRVHLPKRIRASDAHMNAYVIQYNATHMNESVMPHRVTHMADSCHTVYTCSRIRLPKRISARAHVRESPELCVFIFVF